MGDADQAARLKAVLRRFAEGNKAAECVIDDDLIHALSHGIETAVQTSIEPVSEYVGGDDPDRMSVVTIRHGRRTAKSLHFRNVSADTVTSIQAFVTALVGAPGIAAYAATGAAAPSFLPFVVAFSFLTWKSMETPIGWPEACLFYALHEAANFHDFVEEGVALGMGQSLVDRFGYAKGANANEVQDLLDKLEAHGSIRHVSGGYELLEGVRDSWIDWFN